LASSDYTYIDNKKSFAVGEKASFGLGNQDIMYSETTTQNYHTSTVVPFVPGQTTFGNGVSGFGDSRPLVGAPSDLLRKIDEQLNKSKQMY
jgi:hypothetical protein